MTYRQLQVMGLPELRVPGVEADDVIGTVATRAIDAGFHVAIASPDKVGLGSGVGDVAVSVERRLVGCMQAAQFVAVKLSSHALVTGRHAVLGVAGVHCGRGRMVRNSGPDPGMLAVRTCPR